MHVKYLLWQVTGKNLLHKGFHVSTAEDAECSETSETSSIRMVILAPATLRRKLK